MIPRLHRSDSTDFNTNGYGVLNSCINCNVVEELQGAYELNLTLLASDPLLPYVQIGNIITAKPNLTDQRQAFCIESVSKNIDGTVQVYATHIAQYRGKLIPVGPFDSTDLADSLTKLVSNSLESNPFTITTNKTSTVGMSVKYPHSFRELLGGTSGSLIDTYQGELSYNNFTINFLSKRGRDNGVRILYGRNMTDFNMTDEFSYANSVTGLLPYWYREEDGLVVGDIQYSSLVDLYKYHRTVAKDLTDKFSSIPTKADLDAYASTLVNGIGLPNTSIKVEFNQFADVIPNGVATIQLGDTVHVINQQYDVSYSSRIVKTDFNVLSENYNSLIVGGVKADLYSAVSSMMTNQTASSSGGGQVYNVLQARGNADVSIPSDTMTTVPINTSVISFGGSFSLSNDGIRVEKAGVVRVSASLYMNSGTSAYSCGVYIQKNGTEIISSLIAKATDRAFNGAVNVGPILVNASAGDVFTLVARSRGASGTAYASNVATYLLVENIDTATASENPDLSNYYTKSEINSNFYTKSQITSTYYTKNEIGSNYYNKSEIDSKIGDVESLLASI